VSIDFIFIRRLVVFGLLSGCGWSVVAFVLSFGVFGGAITGGFAVSPLIGVLIAAAYRPAAKFPNWVQALLYLSSLYVAVALFGTAVGVYDALLLVPNRASVEVIWQMVITAVLGITITGYALILWPLAFLNHRLLSRLCSTW
jgi:hypothetical protein